MCKWDCLSAGKIIWDRVKTDNGEDAMPIERCQEVGTDFLEWAVKQGFEVNRYFINALTIGKHDTLLALWLLQTDVYSSKFVTLRDAKFSTENALIRFSVYKNSDCCQSTRGMAFDVVDTTGWLKDFIYVDSLYSSFKGAGEQLLKDFCDVFALYTLKGCVGFLHYGDYCHYEDCLEWADEFLERLTGLYLRNGFVDMNAISGFEEQISLIRLGQRDVVGSSNRIDGPVWKELDSLITKRMEVFS